MEKVPAPDFHTWKMNGIICKLGQLEGMYGKPGDIWLHSTQLPVVTLLHLMIPKLLLKLKT